MSNRISTVLLLALVPLASQAVRLSISATNEYAYTTPLTTNLVGIGMGETGDYMVPRYEDIAFLREAYMERMDAATFDVSSYADDPPGVIRDSVLPRAPGNVLGEYSIAHFWPESFGPEGGHGLYDYDGPWWVKRGTNPSYVAADFAFPSSAPIAECPSNWVLRLARERYEHDLQTCYIPYVSTFGTRITPPTLRTNNLISARTPLLPLAITNLYHNLSLAHTIVTPPKEASSPAYLTRAFTGSSARTIRTTVRSPSYTHTPYTNDYTRGTYISGYYTSQGGPTVTQNSSGWVSLAESTCYVTITRVAPIGWEATGRDPDDYYSAILERRVIHSPYTSEERRTVLHPTNHAPIRVYCPQITTNNINLCTNIRCHAAIGATFTLTDSRYADWDGARNPTVVTTNDYAFTCRKVNLTASSDSLNGAVLFDTDLDLCPLVEEFKRFFDPSTDWENRTIPAVSPNVATVPQTLAGYNPGSEPSISANHTEQRTVTISWIRFIFLFDRDFNAKVLTTP